MIYVISRYNHDLSWLDEYDNYFILYDRSESPDKRAIVVPNIGSDIYDKLSFIIDNYDNLPEVGTYIKANLFKYITKEEFDKVKDNKTFTPLLTQNHKEVIQDWGMPNPGQPFSYYKDGMYYELNYPFYLKAHPCKDQPTPITMEWYKGLEILKDLGIDKMEYIPFAPGSNYILPRENILQHPKELYVKLRSYIDWAVYPGECMIFERGLFTLFSKEEKHEGLLDNPALGVPTG